MIFEHLNYRAFLKEVLAEKIGKNPKYSLRALARQVGFSPSMLSEVINGSANFSAVSANKLASKLNLGSVEKEYLNLLVQLDQSKDPEIKESILNRMRGISPKKVKVHDLSIDHYRQISDWYHSAILEIMDLHHFEFTPINIAKKLGISKVEAEVAIERLVRLELLEKCKNGKYVRSHDQLLAKIGPHQFQALKKCYNQMLEKASEALENQSPTERVSGYETMSIPNEAIPEAKKIIEKCFNEMIELSHKYPKKKNVYHLLVHFFNLTHEKE